MSVYSLTTLTPCPRSQRLRRRCICVVNYSTLGACVSVVNDYVDTQFLNSYKKNCVTFILIFFIFQKFDNFTKPFLPVHIVLKLIFLAKNGRKARDTIP